MKKSYGTCTLAALKAELRRRNARISGRKVELVERLEAYDRNANFGRTEELQPEFQMELPPVSAYRDLHSEMEVPAVSIPVINTYLAVVDKQLDKKAVELYRNSFVNHVRAAKVGDKTYLKAECRAEMKTGVVYQIDACVTADGIIHESQCECAAGMGPHAHCKHVCCILYGLSDFNDTGCFKTLATCTERLQTFHQPKKHHGSPVKAETLPLPVSSNIDFDPRPVEYQQADWYKGAFRTIVLNSSRFENAAVRQMYPPANPYGFNNDHDYMKETPTDHFLHTIGLQDVSVDDTKTLEESTRGPNKEAKWKEERSKRLCSSKFGDICRMTEKADADRMAKGIVNAKDFKSKATTHGKVYECVAVRKYESMKSVATAECGLHISEKRPFLGSTPDRRVTSTKLLEVKCLYTARDMAISSQTVPYLILEEGQLVLKRTHPYFYQVQGQMYCTGATCVDFCVFTLVDMKVIEVKRDDTFINEMVEKLDSFWQLHHRQAVLERYFYKYYSEHF